jgi:carboxymethylenebutenolidase
MFLIAALAIATSSTPSCCQAMADLALDPAFLALHEAPLQEDFTPKYGHMIPVNGVSEFVVPANDGSRGAVIMVHEFWGLNNQIKETAEKLHEDTGFGVVAVDLYDGQVATTPEAAGQLMHAVNADKAKAQIKATIDAVLHHELVGKGITKIGTIGYCFGGGWSLQAALSNNHAVKACVMYYGFPELDLHRLNELHAPLLGFFGSQDKGITPVVVEKFKTALNADHKDFEIHSYDAPHAFANPSNPHYNKEATADSWAKTVAFFKELLS